MKKIMNTKGFTLIELTVTVCIIAILAVLVLPTFRSVSEQAKVDIAAAHLTTIWTAQRLYWAENSIFADSLEDLNTAGVLDSSFIAMNDDTDNTPFAYDTYRTGGGIKFEATAIRRNSGAWTGTLMITSTGTITGSITNGSTEIIPTDI